MDEIGDKIRGDKTDKFIDRFASDVFENIDEDQIESIIKIVEFLNLYHKLVVKQQKISMDDEMSFPLYS